MERIRERTKSIPQRHKHYVANDPWPLDPAWPSAQTDRLLISDRRTTTVRSIRPPNIHCVPIAAYIGKSTIVRVEGLHSQRPLQTAGWRGTIALAAPRQRSSSVDTGGAKEDDCELSRTAVSAAIVAPNIPITTLVIAGVFSGQQAILADMLTDRHFRWQRAQFSVPQRRTVVPSSASRRAPQVCVRSILCDKAQPPTQLASQLGRPPRARRPRGAAVRRAGRCSLAGVARLPRARPAVRTHACMVACGTAVAVRGDSRGASAALLNSMNGQDAATPVERCTPLRSAAGVRRRDGHSTGSVATSCAAALAAGATRDAGRGAGGATTCVPRSACHLRTCMRVRCPVSGCTWRMHVLHGDGGRGTRSMPAGATRLSLPGR